MNHSLETCYQSNALIKRESEQLGQENEALKRQLESMRDDIQTYKKSHQHALILKGELEWKVREEDLMEISRKFNEQRVKQFGFRCLLYAVTTSKVGFSSSS